MPTRNTWQTIEHCFVKNLKKTLPILIHMKTRGFGLSSVHCTGLDVLYRMAAQSRLLAPQPLISLGVTICRTAVVVAKRAFPA